MYKSDVITAKYKKVRCHDGLCFHFSMKAAYRDAVSFVNYTCLLPKPSSTVSNRTDLYECGGPSLFVVVVLKPSALCLINVFFSRTIRVTSLQ